MGGYWRVWAGMGGYGPWMGHWLGFRQSTAELQCSAGGVAVLPSVSALSGRVAVLVPLYCTSATQLYCT